MKIKVGDWVNVIINVEDGKVVHNRIAKCHTHRNGLVYYFNGDRIVYAIEENVEKLPIKFKGFEIVLDNSEPWGGSSSWGTYRKIEGFGLCIRGLVNDGERIRLGRSK